MDAEESHKLRLQQPAAEGGYHARQQPSPHSYRRIQFPSMCLPYCLENGLTRQICVKNASQRDIWEHVGMLLLFHA